MADDFFERLRGTSRNIFQIGLNNIKAAVAGVFEFRNSADSAFVVARGADPVGDDDFTTKRYVNQLAKPIIVDGQFDGNNALPANTGTEHFYVVTVSGPNATIGQLVRDNGSSSGTAAVLSAVDGRVIVTTIALTGGVFALRAESLYAWDATTSTWINAGGTQQSGAIREVRFAIANTPATQQSTIKIPANATLVEAGVHIVTPFSPAATLKIGRTGSTALLLDTTDNNPQLANLYVASQDTAWGGTELELLVTVGGAPAAGAGFAWAKYTTPDA